MACYIYKGNTYTKEELLAIKNQIIAENEAVFNQMGSEALNDVNVLVDQLVKGGLAEEVIVGNTQTLLDVLDEVGASEGLKQQVQQGPERQIILNGQGVTVRTLPEDVSVINGFYSPIEKRLSETKIDKQSANKWLSVIGKGDEATWTGVKAWLEEKNPQEQVTKSEIQQWMKDNRISVVEVVKTDKTTKEQYNEDAIKKGDKVGLEIEFGSENEIQIRLPGEGYLIPSDVDTQKNREFTSKNYEVDISVLEIANELFDENKSKRYRSSNEDQVFNTKFSQYQLEGEKENYKEVLVTLPAKPLTFEEYKTESAKGGVVFGSDERARESYNDYLKEPGKDVSKSANFLSRHFDEPNILVHLRMNTRTDSEGNKVLFLEEVQSDWGQIGKKEGFKQNNLEQLKNQLVEAENEYNKLDFINLKLSEVMNTPEAKKVEELREKINAEEKVIAPAPFVMDTNTWTKLGLKVALKEAVKQGADKIAWTTGEQQNDRYDLSKQVDVVDAKRNKDGTYEVEATKDGSKIFGKSDMPLKEIEDTFGKDVAQKINDSKSPLINISGDNLKAGGKGMKGFYGSPTEGSLGIVGNVAKSLFKQEPKTVELQTTSTGIASQDKVLRLRDWVQKNKNEDYSYNDAQKDIDNNSKLYQEYQKNIPTQHSIDITPELKSQVEEGLPLFQKEPVKLIPTGFVKGKKVYINSDVATVETPIHEFAHLYNAWLKENKAELYNRGLELVRAELSKGAIDVESFNKSTIAKIESLYNGDKDSVSLKINGVTLELGTEELESGDRSIYISEISSDEKGKGKATKVLNQLKKYASENNIPLSLRASVSNNISTSKEGALNQEQLVKWYDKNGFKIAEEENTSDTDESAPFMVYYGEEASPIQSVIDYVKSTQPNLQGEALQEEILTQLTGKKGLELLQSKKKGGIINWIKEALAEIANMLGLSNYSIEKAMNMTIDEFAKAIAVDLLQGQKPIGITVEEAIKRNNGNPLNLAPNGNPSILYQSYKDLGYFDNEAERFTAQTFSNEFKTWFGDWQNDAENASKVMDENGQPKLMYHETAADWFIYDKTKIEAGKLDSVTPTGIFLKSSNKNIGLGNRQMNLFSSIKNPIYAKDRKELENFFSLNIKGYSEIKEKSSQVEKEYDKILEKEGPRLKEAFKKEIEDFKGELTSEDRIKLVEKVYKNSDTELNDLEVEFENLAIEAKALIDSFMKDSNYDGIFLTSDVGSKGRETDATIAMNPEQIKSATGNIGTFSPTNADIRFQTIPTEETTTIPDCV